MGRFHVLIPTSRSLTLNSELEGLSDDFPEEFFKMKILPELLNSVVFGGGGPKVFAVIMKIAQKLDDVDFDARVTPVIIRLFASPDRAIRVCLLDNLPLMIDRLSQKIVNDKIYPQLITGFSDVAPLIREQTVKSVLVVITKLSDRTINSDLLKHLARTSNDEQPGIRTNTTICLGKIAKNLGVQSRSKVLIAAFSRSLRDPFVHARNAALMALAATADSFTDEDAATKIMPAVSPLLLDKEKIVRDQAFKTLDIYFKQVRRAANSMPDTALPSPQAETRSGSTTPRMSTPAQSEGAAGWAGWAISGFTNKLATAVGEIQPTSTTPVNGGLVAPPQIQPAARSPIRASASASTLARQAVTSPPPQSTRTSTSSASGSGKNAAAYFEDPSENHEDEFEAWGDMDDDDTAFKDAIEKPASKPVSTKPFGDGEEPDFAGWLAAQAGKKPGAKPLPKGLGKVAPRPAASQRSSTTGCTGTGLGARKVSNTIPIKPKLAPKKVEEVKKEVVDDDSWGEGWD